MSKNEKKKKKQCRKLEKFKISVPRTLNPAILRLQGAGNFGRKSWKIFARTSLNTLSQVKLSIGRVPVVHTLLNEFNSFRESLETYYGHY